MKVWIDQDLCTGDGLCEEIAPDVFTLLDDGLAYVKEGAQGLLRPGRGRGSGRLPRRHARRRRRVRRGVPRRVHLHRSRVGRRSSALASRRGSGRSATGAGLVRLDRPQHRLDLRVGERVGGRAPAGVDGEGHADDLARAAFTSAPPESPGASVGREHVHVPVARARAVDVGADGEDLVADAGR